MGDAHATTTDPHAPGADAHGHGHHDPNLGHHWADMDQQDEAGKFGMWLFLSTEVLLFAGLFCAYAVYRSNHPEIFVFGEKYLNKWLGGLNTLVLLMSSFTVALAVRYSQMGDRKKTLVCLGLTLLGAFGFLTIKGFEYHHKYDAGALWGAHFHLVEPPEAGRDREEDTRVAGRAAPVVAVEPERELDYNVRTPWEQSPAEKDRSLVKTPTNIPEVKTVDARVVEEKTEAEGEDPLAGQSDEVRHRAHIFFGIYFIMTGLHGLHVIIGALAIMWVMFRTYRGDFSKSYNLPVDLVGLYWHLVDLIWIYLFPLLYLIG